MIDTIITGDDVLPYHDGCFYWGYFSSIVVRPDYRQHGVATQMLFYWLNLIFRLATERNIYFKKIVADAVSNVGTHLLLYAICFYLVKSSKYSSKIMTLGPFVIVEIHFKIFEMMLI